MNPFDLITDIVERWRFGDECRPSPPLPPEPTEPAPEYEAPVSRPRTITRVGAWAGAALLRDPKRNVLAAKAAGLDDLHLMVADHSAWRTEHAFAERPEKGRRAASTTDLVRVGRICNEAGIDLGLTTWVMPTPRYVESCAGYLLDAVLVLAENDIHVTEIILDAEEPWTQTAGVTTRERNLAAAKIGALLAPLREQPYEVRFGLTGIGYARESALDGLAAWCDFAVPQVYPTVNNGLDPRKSPKFFADRWTKAFERGELVLGLPAYRQGPGMMAAALAGAREVAQDPNSAECSGAIYWSLAHIRASKAITRFVAGIKEGGR
jgi:hypothetical protein